MFGSIKSQWSGIRLRCDLEKLMELEMVTLRLSAIQEFALLSQDVGPQKVTQFDLKQATGFEALSVVPMNTLLLIKEK